MTFSKTRKVGKGRVTKCNQTFGLCPAAKCIPDPTNFKKYMCLCDVGNGINYSYGNKTCKDIAGRKDKYGRKIIYSTYSPQLNKKGYKMIKCKSKGTNLNCMNKICTVDPNNPKKAICICSKTDNKNKEWYTIAPKGKVSSCNYLSGASPAMAFSLNNFIKSK